MTNFGKDEKTILSGFYSAKMVNISKWSPTLYILQVGPCSHVFQVLHMSLG
jgi:hypothetical protein